MEPTTPLHISCHCTSTTHTFSIPTSALPLPTHLCSCTSSRHVSGALLTSYVDISLPTQLVPSPPNPDISTCTPYQSSETLTRWACKGCGAAVYVQRHGEGGGFMASTGLVGWGEVGGGEGVGGGEVLLAGVVSEGRVGDEEGGGAKDGLVDVRGVVWVGDTQDGGASSFLADVGGREAKRWIGEADESEEISSDWQSTTIPPSLSNATRENALYAHCHCLGVEFWISPPHDTSKLARSPFPDLLTPHHQHRSANPDNTPWWLPSPGKYLAGTCACTSCRLTSGFDTTFWAFIPTCNIFLDAALTRPFPHDRTLPPVWGTMKTYTSSPGVTRSFCGKCGANVLWSGDEEHTGRVGLVDVAVGLLDASTGARAEEWLDWWSERVSFREEANNRGLVVGLERGLKARSGQRVVEGAESA